MDKQTMLEVLEKAREEWKPSEYTQYKYAEDARGNHVSIYSPIATKFCAMGKISRVLSIIHGLSESFSINSLLNEEADKMSPNHSTIQGVSDHEGYWAATDVIDAAIARLKRELEEERHDEEEKGGRVEAVEKTRELALV